MVKTCRKYWNRTIMDSIVQLKNIVFDNPQFSLTTTFDREDFTNILVQPLRHRPEPGGGVLRHRRPG